MFEQREDRDKRWTYLYDKYVNECKASDAEYISYVNWVVGQKNKDVEAGIVCT